MNGNKQQFNANSKGSSSEPSDFSFIKIKNPPDANLFSDIAEECAKRLQSKNKNKPSQIRQFYDEICLWTEKMKKGKPYEEVIPFVQMIRARVAYAKGRDLVDENFLKFANTIINQIKNPETLEIARTFWEAFMGFYKEKCPKD